MTIWRCIGTPDWMIGGDLESKEATVIPAVKLISLVSVKGQNTETLARNLRDLDSRYYLDEESALS